MKTLITSLLVAAVLLLSTPQIQAPEPTPKPQMITCVMTIICLGIFSACVVACYWHAWNSDYSGPTNAPPIVPQTPDEPPDTQTNLPPLCTNIPPITVNAVESVQHLDATPYGWVDSGNNQVTDLYRTVLQTSSSPSGPWSNAYVVTMWQSAYGSTMLVEDGAGTAMATNYTRRAGNGSVTNRLPLEISFSEPQKFYRAKP